MELQAKGLKWLKDLKDGFLKEMIALWHEAEGRSKDTDRELKEFKLEAGQHVAVQQ